MITEASDLAADATKPARVSKHRRDPASRGERIWAFNFLAPFIVGIAVFYYIAIVASSYFSFTRYNLLKPPTWLGLDNYRFLIGNELFRKALWNTAKLTLVGVPVTIVLVVGLGVALNSRIRFQGVYRLIFFLPLVTMPVASAIVWRWMYSPETGLFDQLLGPFGVDRVEWLSRPGSALWAVLAMEVWRQSGLFLLIVLAGLQNIPEVYYEAATVDGATAWQRFRHVTLPLLSPSLFFLAVTGSIAAFQTFDAVIVLTPGGGPLNSTRTVVFDIYGSAFESLRMGRAAAASMLLLAVILVVTAVQFRMQKRWVHYE
ncbi:MAG: sugar ABC transporter permease [Acidimicrobiaceae bacterium]|nr:sugar ABC transporter permease [Acidimicrobiaceae bacterium]